MSANSPRIGRILVPCAALVVACALSCLAAEPAAPKADDAEIFELGSRIESADPATRREALTRVLQLGGETRKIYSRILAATNDPDLSVQALAIEAAERLDKDPSRLAELLEKLKSPDYNTRFGATMALGKLRELAKSAVPLLIAELSSREGSLAREAANTLGLIGPDAGSAVKALVVAIDNPQADDAPIQALGKLGPAAAGAVPVLADIASGRRPGQKLSAVRALAKLGPVAAPAVEDLVALVKADALSSDLRDALFALGPVALPQLERLMVDPDRGARSVALEVLSKLGPAAKRVVPKLLAAYTDAERPGQIVAALAAVDPDALKKLFAQSKEPRARVRLVEALDDVGPAGLPLLPLLVPILEDPDDHLRQWAAKAVGGMGPGAASAYPSLAKLLDDKGQFVAGAAVRAVGQLGAVSGPAVPRILQYLDSQQDFLEREMALTAIAMIGPSAKAAVPRLIQELRDDKGDWSSAAHALSCIGPDAKEAVPAIRERMAKSPDCDQNALGLSAERIEAPAGTR